MKQPWRDGGPSRRPRRVQRRMPPWLWKAVMIAAVVYALAQLWQIWDRPGP